ncbi:MAG: non-ribosomal peptide synthetase, partial [Gemmatimonadales bacterium]
VVRLDAEDHVLLIETHHIVCDGWSMGVMWRDLNASYSARRRGAAPEFPLPVVQYGDYAAWQRETLRGAKLEKLLAYWRERLGATTESLNLPTDFARPASPGFAGGRCSLLLSRALLEQVRQLGQQHGATLYMVLLAAYMTVLHRYSGRERLLVGSGSAGRNRRDTEGMVGYLSNTLVQQGDFSGDPSFAEILRRVRESTLGAVDHQDVPLEKLVLELRSGNDRFDPAPLFQVVFTMQNATEVRLELDGLEVRPQGVDFSITKFDLTLLPSERTDRLLLFLRYRADLYTEATAVRFLGHVQHLLESAVDDASRPVSHLSMLTEPELAELGAWNASSRRFDAPDTVHAAVHAAALRSPGTVAVIGADGELTYAQIESGANRIAHRLIALGARPGSCVGLCLDRSAEAVTALLGILKAGASYVPLVPDLPPSRLTAQAAQAGVRLVVTRAEFAPIFAADVNLLCLDRESVTIAGASATNPGINVAPDGVAYLLFTSGSTGEPKGVAVTHANLMNYANAICSRLGTSTGHPLAYATVTSLGTDLGNTAIFPALITGGTVHVIPGAVATDAARFGEYAGLHRIDVLKITPNHFRALLGGPHGDAILPSQWLVFGGEPLAWDLAERVQRAGACRVLNHYGPTETTVGCAAFEVTPDSATQVRAVGAQTVPIGMPLANVQLYVVDPHDEVVPVGVPGELLVAGAGVAAGYIDRPAPTAEAFVQREGIERVYRTGDRVRRLPTGDLEFLGRLDGQVKIRGYRVELGEIEHALAAHPGVAQAVVVLRGGSGTDADSTLTAYVVLHSGGYAAAHAERPTAESLGEWLADRLPAYMVPPTFVFLKELPLTRNGKVDRQQLPALNAIDALDTYRPPRTELEAALATIWAEVLKRDRVGIADNFLALGGHSLLAIRVLGRISKQFGVRLPLRVLFEKPTIEHLAVELDLEVRLSALERMTEDEATQRLADDPGQQGPA